MLIFFFVNFFIIKRNGETSAVGGETNEKAQKLFLYKTCIFIYYSQFTSVLHFYIFFELASELSVSQWSLWYVKY